MHNQDLGRVSVVARGIYDPLAAYERLDAVSYNGSSYLVRKHCQGVEPAEGEYYMLMAQAGDSTAANAAAAQALAAAEMANDSSGRADTAAGNADNMAAAAGAAAASANAAAGNANTAAAGASSAKEEAETAAAAANNAAAAANQNAEAAATATSAANAAASLADDAASGADTARDAAGSAAEAANAAAAAAQDVVNSVQSDINQIKSDVSATSLVYPGVDLTAQFAGEIAGYDDPGAWIRARIRANNFDGIHINDYIPFTTTNGLKFKARVAGIDPYYEYGDSAVGHHIDFVCEELWPTLKPINPINYNNGLIPTENVTSDGTATQYVLTKPMYGVAKVTLGGTDLTGWTYDKDTYTLTFSTAPAAGTMVVTGTGSEYPWLASDAYLYVNSLAGHVANGTGLNPAIKRVDYTNDGIYHYLPDWLKAVIIEKRFLLNKRYSATGILSDENSWGWANLGKLWFPTEVEVYGCPVWGSKGGYGLGGSIQYPLFMGNMRRLKKRNGSRVGWWLLSPSAGTTGWCYVGNGGGAYDYGASYDWIAAPVCFRIG